MKRRRVKSVWHTHTHTHSHTSTSSDTQSHTPSAGSEFELLFLRWTVACVWLHIHVIIFSHFYAIILCSGRKSNASTPTVKPRLSKNICFYSLTFRFAVALGKLVLVVHTYISLFGYTLTRTRTIRTYKIELCCCCEWNAPNGRGFSLGFIITKAYKSTAIRNVHAILASNSKRGGNDKDITHNRSLVNKMYNITHSTIFLIIIFHHLHIEKFQAPESVEDLHLMEKNSKVPEKLDGSEKCSDIFGEEIHRNENSYTINSLYCQQFYVSRTQMQAKERQQRKKKNKRLVSCPSKSYTKLFLPFPFAFFSIHYQNAYTNTYTFEPLALPMVCIVTAAFFLLAFHFILVRGRARESVRVSVNDFSEGTSCENLSMHG